MAGLGEQLRRQLDDQRQTDFLFALVGDLSGPEYAKLRADVNLGRDGL
jgi:hypothetical protein